MSIQFVTQQIVNLQLLIDKGISKNISSIIMFYIICISTIWCKYCYKITTNTSRIIVYDSKRDYWRTLDATRGVPYGQIRFLEPDTNFIWAASNYEVEKINIKTKRSQSSVLNSSLNNSYINGLSLIDNYLWISLVRNPLDRACSSWKKHGWSFDDSIENNVSFAEKITDIESNKQLTLPKNPI